MGIKDPVKRERIRVWGWAVVGLLCVLFWLYNMKLGFRGTVGYIAGWGILLVIGTVVGAIVRVIPYKVKFLAMNFAISALFGWLVGGGVTAAQFYLLKFPRQFTDKLMLTNSLVATAFIFWQRRGERPGEENDQND